jgi:hypothetical protein
VKRYIFCLFFIFVHHSYGETIENKRNEATLLISEIITLISVENSEEKLDETLDMLSKIKSNFDESAADEQYKHKCFQVLLGSDIRSDIAVRWCKSVINNSTKLSCFQDLRGRGFKYDTAVRRCRSIDNSSKLSCFQDLLGRGYRSDTAVQRCEDD